jgi:Cupin
MLFTQVIAAAILASVSLAAPASAPDKQPISSTTTTSTSSGTATSTTSIVPPPPATSTPSSSTLSLTQQLFLADTAADRIALLPKDSQFVFDFGNPALKGKGGKGGDLVAANRKTFPALVGTGSGMAVGFLGPCGFNTPHVHPRGTELQIVTSGRLITEMLPENGVFNDNAAANGRRVITNTLTANMMTPFYQGSVHTQFNPDCAPATFVASFNSEEFGTGQITDELFSMSADVVSAAFGQAVDGADVAKFKTAIPASIAKGVEACLKQCGIAKR